MFPVKELKQELSASFRTMWDRNRRGQVGNGIWSFALNATDTQLSSDSDLSSSDSDFLTEWVEIGDEDADTDVEEETMKSETSSDEEGEGLDQGFKIAKISAKKLLDSDDSELSTTEDDSPKNKKNDFKTDSSDDDEEPKPRKFDFSGYPKGMNSIKFDSP